MTSESRNLTVFLMKGLMCLWKGWCVLFFKMCKLYIVIWVLYMYWNQGSFIHDTARLLKAIAFVEERPLKELFKTNAFKGVSLLHGTFFEGFGEWIYAGFTGLWLFQVWTRGGETNKTRMPELRKSDPWNRAKRLFIEQFGQAAQSQAGSLKEFVLVPVGEEQKTWDFVCCCTLHIDAHRG